MMDESDSLGDAEMRFVTVNGQTIMLEGDFRNMNLTNEVLNEMLMSNSTKQPGSDDCVEMNGNHCMDDLKNVNSDLTRIEITVQGENNELQVIQLGMDEAKALGLYLPAERTDSGATGNQSGLIDNGDIQSQGQISVVSIGNIKSETENDIVQTNTNSESMPLLDLECPIKEETGLSSDDITDEKLCEINGSASDFQFNTCNDASNVSESKQLNVPIQEENSSDNFPAIGHLEDFQIPTAEDGTLLPATVNAKMADGSYQMLTLIPQILDDGNVTYTVQLANFDNDEGDSNSKMLNETFHENEFNGEAAHDNSTISSKDMKSNKASVVQEFLNSVQAKRNEKARNGLSDHFLETPVGNGNTNNVALNIVNQLSNQNILKSSTSNNFVVANNLNFENLSTNFLTQPPAQAPSQHAQVPIETKIDNLISENENVISKYKKLKYGKKTKVDPLPSVDIMENMAKSNLVRAKKVKFKNKASLKSPGEGVEQKKIKLSLLKPNNEQVQVNASDILNGRKLENIKPITPSLNKNLISHMNMNCRLEFPNLKAPDVSSSSYLKIKSQSATKQPYFNVLPAPKDKTIPEQRQILPLNCDLQQAKNLISLQKFLETQKFQLKIQPMSSNGTKLTNIRPKPTLGEQLKVLQDLGISTPVLNNTSNDKPVTNNSYPVQPCPINTNSYQESSDKLQITNAKDVLLSEGKMNFHKFLRPLSTETEKEPEKESSSSFCSKNGEIFIKNNPGYFNQKLKDGKADEHPLGSTENPIQLVQTGHTFHSRQPLSESQLRQIASILQKQKFDSPNVKKNSIFDPKTNTRIVYRVVYPEDVELRRLDNNSPDGVQKKKRGRHRTKPLNEDGDKRSCAMTGGPRGPGRPKTKKPVTSTQEEETVEDEVDDTPPKKKIPRTRSGRLSRPPRYMVKDYKRLHNSDMEKNSNANYDSDGGYSDYQSGKEATKERMDKIQDIETNLLPGLRPRQRTQRNFKPEYRCPTCQKIYLGHTRMMWHLNKFPDHCSVEKYEEIYYTKRTETKVRRAARRFNLCDATGKIMQILSSMPKDELTSLCGPLLADALTTWDFLLLRVNLIKDEMKGEVDALLHELALLLEKLTKIAEDLLFPVFTKSSENESEYVEIDKMEIAIALGLPTGVYKINNDNLNLLRLPVKNRPREPPPKEPEPEKDPEISKADEMFTNPEEEKSALLLDKSNSWEDKKNEVKKMEEDDPFWMESKVEDSDKWHDPSDSSSVKALATKFEPNLSTKLLESSNDSIDDAKYEERVPLLDLDSNSKDIEHSNSSENLDESSEINIKDHSENSESIDGKTNESETTEKVTSRLWNGTSVSDKVSPELWGENSNIVPPTDKRAPNLWNENSNITSGDDKPSQLWNENSNMATTNEKPSPPPLWNDNSNITANEKVDETNSEFLDTFLSAQNSNEFLGNGNSAFLTGEMELMKTEKSKDVPDSGSKKSEWSEERGGNFIRLWETEKSSEWSKEEAEILSTGLHERMPGPRTATRLTSTPETNGNIGFNIPNRRNSISDFSNINLEPAGLDIVLPPAKTLIKERTKQDSLEKMDHNFKDAVPFLESSENFKLKNWTSDGDKQEDFSGANVNSEDLMKMALESLTSPHDVINVPATSFDSAMGILNPSQETGNLNLFNSSEPDGLDFNLPLPDHLLRTNFTTNNNFTSSNFQTTCTSNFSNSVSPTFMSTTNNLFGTTSTLSNSMKFDQFEANFPDKKSKLDDDVIEFFDQKNAFTSYDNCNINETNNMSNFSFVSTSSHSDRYSVTQCLSDSIVSAFVPDDDSKSKKKTKSRVNNKKSNKSNEKDKTVRSSSSSGQKGKKMKGKKIVDYPKSKSIESIINEALFDSCGPQRSNPKSLQLEDSSPTGNSVITNGTDSFSLPIIPESLDEVGNLDFLNQD